MSVKKTFENLLPQVEWKSAVTLDLIEGQLQKAEEVQSFEIDSWPILLFLKGIGFQKIIFQPKSIDVVEIWAQRIQNIENTFIQDPENFARDEYQWNEKGFESEEVLIECIGIEIRKDRELLNVANTVPPMDAPLGITSEATTHFLDEVRRQSPQEIFQRILSILVEYERDVRHRDEKLWAGLVGDVITVALQSHLLEKALRIASEHRQALEPLWRNRERLIRLLSAYDPKPGEVQDWAQLIEACPTETLISLLDTDLSSAAGPQILKLMNFRAQQDPDHLIPHIRNQSSSVQKLLMQWLAPHWRPKHLLFLEGAIHLLAENNHDEDLFKVWIAALIRSAPKEGFEKLESYFKASKWFWRKKIINPSFQRALLSTLSEHPGLETFEFLKKIRKTIAPEFKHQLDTLIGNYRKLVN